MGIKRSISLFAGAAFLCTVTSTELPEGEVNQLPSPAMQQFLLDHAAQIEQILTARENLVKTGGELEALISSYTVGNEQIKDRGLYWKVWGRIDIVHTELIAAIDQTNLQIDKGTNPLRAISQEIHILRKAHQEFKQIAADHPELQDIIEEQGHCIRTLYTDETDITVCSTNGEEIYRTANDTTIPLYPGQSSNSAALYVVNGLLFEQRLYSLESAIHRLLQHFQYLEQTASLYGERKLG